MELLVQVVYLFSGERAKMLYKDAPRAIPFRGIKFLVSFCLTLVLLTNFYEITKAQTTALTPTSRPAVQIKAGFDNYYKLNSWLPVQVNLSLPAGGSNFDGSLEASFTNFSSDSTIYRRAVQLVPPANRQVWFYLPTGNHNLQGVQVRLVNREGLVLDSQDISIQPLDQSDLVVGVISDNPNALAAIRGMRLTQAYNKGSIFYAINYYSRTPAAGIIPSLRVIPISPQDLPPESSGWDSLDGLVLTDLSYPTQLGQLQNEAGLQSAAAAWLVGGRFLFTAGDNSLTRSGFLGDFLPVKQSGTPRTQPLPDLLRPFLTEPVEPSGLLVADTSLLQGASAQLSQDGKPVLAEKPFGLGRSWFCATDFSGLPNSILVAIWKIAFQDYEPHLSYTTGLRQPTELNPSWVTQLSPNTRLATLPDVNLIGIILGIYILALGPISYMALKKLRKPMLGWFTVPILAFSLTCSFYFAGEITGGEPLVLSRLSVVMLGETAGGRMTGGVTSLETLYSNSRLNLNLKVNDRTQVIGLNSNLNGPEQGFTNANDNFSIIQQGPGGGFGNVLLGQDDQRSFVMESPTPPQVGEGIAASLTAQGNELTGTIENRSRADWRNLSIWKSGNIIYQVPLIKAGEKITLQNNYALNNRTDSLVLVLAGLVDGKAGTSNSALSFGSPAFQSQEVTVLTTLLGSEGQVLPRGANRFYLIGWSDATFDFPLQVGNQAANSKDLTLLFEPLALS